MGICWFLVMPTLERRDSELDLPLKFGRFIAVKGSQVMLDGENYEGLDVAGIFRFIYVGNVKIHDGNRLVPHFQVSSNENVA